MYNSWLQAVQIFKPCQYLFSPSSHSLHVHFLVLLAISNYMLTLVKYKLKRLKHLGIFYARKAKWNKQYVRR
jgi:hypothetical protein